MVKKAFLNIFGSRIHKMNGIVTVLNTPFTQTGGIDLGGLRRNAEIALESGVAGFLVSALAGEVETLTVEERNAVAVAVLEVADARVPVIGGTFAATQQERVEVGRRLLDCGCHGIMVSMPFSDESRFEADLRQLADLHPEILMVQDWDPSGAGIPVPVIGRLFERIAEFNWLKIEVVPAGPKYTGVLEMTEGRLKVAGGWAVMQMIEALDRGVHAFMPTAMHPIYCEIYRRYADGERDSARQLFDAVLPVLAFSNQSLEISIQFFKRLLAAQGVYETDLVRIPCAPFDEAQQLIADELVAKVIHIEAVL